MKIFIFVFVTLFVLSCEKSDKTEVKDADQLVALVIDALGGYDSLKAIITIVNDGHYIEPGYKLLMKAHVEKMRPDFRIIGDPVKLGYAEGYNGSAWEYFDGKVTHTDGEAAAATRRGAEFDYPFVDWKQKGHSIKLLGTEEINGVMYHSLEVVLKDGWKLNYYFDTHNFLPSYFRKAMPLHAVGNDIHYIVSNSDFRQVRGVFIPFTSIERDERTGKMVNATVIDSLTVNVTIDRSRFEPPVTPE